MERLLKTLRYNFLTEALDFVGVHQERTLQVGGCQGWGLRVTGVLSHSGPEAWELRGISAPISEALRTIG